VPRGRAEGAFFVETSKRGGTSVPRLVGTGKARTKGWREKASCQPALPGTLPVLDEAATPDPLITSLHGEGRLSASSFFRSQSMSR